YNAPIIALDKKAENDSIRKIIGVEEGQKFVKVTDFFDQRGVNKLDPFLEEAYKTNTPNKFQQDFKQAGQKLALLNRALSGEILKVFPLPQDENNKWISSIEYRTGVYTVSDTLYGSFVANSLPYYLQLLNQAQTTQDYTEADKILSSLKKSQRKLGEEVMPSERKIRAEISYNKWDIFNKLYRYYAMFGLLLFFVLVAQIYKNRKALTYTITAFKVFIYALVFLHTFGLIARSYISGHAPWSDAYESILYVSWATMAIGIALGRKSNFTIASTTFVSSMLLWIAHQSWVDPAIANLQPVLDSYWLMIHVAVIVGSYGPLTVGMILGVVNLILLLLLKPSTLDRMKSSVKELTIINELSLTIGLLMLTIGNFLGGQWANESWGRYWGWDPKETWALISIMVYAFVLHMRLIPALKGVWAFNLASIIAFASIMMTYFGVNFYLVGLHSYASGDQVITPSFVWYTVAGVLVLGYFSYLKYKKYY
ncbi:MAG: cytochrome c biogenesis protein, partial [Flavobacteriaceae bacterium]